MYGLKKDELIFNLKATIIKTINTIFLITACIGVIIKTFPKQPQFPPFPLKMI